MQRGMEALSPPGSTQGQLGIQRLAFSTSIFLLWFAAVFDPVGNLFQLRYLALGSALACITLDAVFRLRTKLRLDLRVTAIFYLAVVMPIHGLLLYVLRGGGAEFVDTSYIAAGILVLSSLLYVDRRYCDFGITAMQVSLWLLTATILAVYVLMFLEIDHRMISFFTESNVALISTREYGGISLPYIYFLASPMLIYLIGHEIDRLMKKPSLQTLALTAAAVFAFALSGTRAHMLISALFVPVYYFLMVRDKRPQTMLAYGVVLLGFAAYYGADVLRDFFSTKEDSNELKIQLLDMYSDAFSDPLMFFFGQGYNAHGWYAPLRDKLVGIEGASKTELTYLELIRVYGLVGAAIFFVLIVEVLRRVARVDDRFRWLYPSYLVFMVNAALNPYLFSTNGMLPLGLILAIISLPPAHPSESARTTAPGPR
jgi:hypothetical protein